MVFKISFIIYITCSFALLKVTKLEPIGEGHCIWHDVCGQNPDKPSNVLGTSDVNCLYEGPAKLLDRTAVITLESICPDLMNELNDLYQGGSVYTCCSPANVKELKKQFINLNAVVSRCTACINNMKIDFCYFTCHPRQSDFVVPTTIIPYGDDQHAVTAVDFYMNPQYSEGAFESCEYVYYPPLNDVALGLLCGPYGSDFCTPERLFTYMGNNDFAPFNITYYFGTEDTSFKNYDGTEVLLHSFNVATTPCNSTDEDLSCSCTDCRDSCPVLTPPKEIVPEMVGELQLYVFILLMVFAVFSALVILGLIFSCILKGNKKKERQLFIYTYCQKTSAYVERILQTAFERYGNGVSHHPFLAMFFGLALVAILAGGIYKAETTNDPVDLWAGPESRSRKEKDYFDEKFDPFYRTTQVICNIPNGDTFTKEILLDGVSLGNVTFGPVFTEDIMLEGMRLQLEIMNLKGDFEGVEVTPNDICIKPLAPQTEECLIQSIFNYWQNDIEKLQKEINEGTYLEHLVKCMNNPTYMSPNAGENCMGTYGGPVFPYVALGGFLEPNQSTSDKNAYEKSTAFILTFLNQNYVDREKLEPAKAWELRFIEYMESFSSENLDCAYYSERSVEDQIREIGEGDVITVLASYIIMFVYITLSLGGSRSIGRKCMVNLKITLGLGGVMLVLLSVIAAFGFYGYLEIQSTVFVLEVVPFITLAVGVDNIFLLVQTWQRTDRRPGETVEQHVGRILGLVGPSMLLATVTETTCFFLGALSDMPAVHTFALNAGMALLIDFVLQISCFVAMLTFDARRVEASRYDFVCCKKSDDKVEKKDTVLFGNFFKKYYGPFLMHNFTRAVVLITFVGATLVSGIYIPKLGIGLDQNVAMPDDSYVLKYFQYMEAYLSVGSPVYFVMSEGYNYSDFESQNYICSTKHCEEDSVLSQIFLASLNPEVTEIATGASSWLEAYFDWITDSVGILNIFNLESVKEACCRLDENGDFINSSLASAENAERTCLRSKNIQNGRPETELFMEYLPSFLIDNPHELLCSSAGHAAYGPAVRILGEHPESQVGANYFMAYHTVLSTSTEFTGACREAYKITDQINEYLQEKLPGTNVTFFPYSIFYVYYEQYLDFWPIAGKTMGISFGSLFIVMFIAFGFDIVTALINMVIIFMILADVMGCMYAWSIEFNAVSLVNLVMVSGISVEFCAHFTHAFNQVISGTRKERTISTLATTGASILSGIAITKLAGIIILGFANSQVFVIYYFRMYLLMVIFAVSHGLIFLPVLTSLIGAPVNPYTRDLTERNIINRTGGALFHKKEENGRSNFSFENEHL